MLNLLSVLQLLSVKVSVDKVDSFYPHNPKAKVNFSECSRFRASAQDVKDWIEKLGMCYANVLVTTYLFTKLLYYNTEIMMRQRYQSKLSFIVSDFVNLIELKNNESGYVFNSV